MMRARPSRVPLLLVALALALAAPAAASPPASRAELSARPPAPGERALEARLLAPCCWKGTLDAHESEPAQALRMEIRGRLYAGETVAAVGESLIQQYGERIRATPARDPLPFVVAGVLALAALAGLGVLRVLRRWRRAAKPDTPALALAPAAPDGYDARLDAELSALD